MSSRGGSTRQPKDSSTTRHHNRSSSNGDSGSGGRRGRGSEGRGRGGVGVGVPSHGAPSSNSRPLNPNLPAFVPVLSEASSSSSPYFSGDSLPASSSRQRALTTREMRTRQPPFNYTDKAIKEPEEYSSLDLTARLILQLQKSSYECMVCIDTIRVKDKIYSCPSCFAMFHLSCLQKWSKTSASSSHQQLARGSNVEPLFDWRCPAGCQHVSKELPLQYKCFCGKMEEPDFNHFFTPHSCGDQCARKQPKCLHKCFEKCHPGPCKPCTSYSPAFQCFCGKRKLVKKCVERLSASTSDSCGLVCGLSLR